MDEILGVLAYNLGLREATLNYYEQLINTTYTQLFSKLMWFAILDISFCILHRFLGQNKQSVGYRRVKNGQAKFIHNYRFGEQNDSDEEDQLTDERWFWGGISRDQLLTV